MQKKRFQEADITTAELDARLLLQHASELNHEMLVMHFMDAIPNSVVEKFECFIEKRLAGYSVARMLGEKEFYGLSLFLSDATLEPRPDTEAVVELALKCIQFRKSEIDILDLGVGTGPLLLALLSVFPAAEGIGIDKSEKAIQTALLNAKRHKFQTRASFYCGQWADSIDYTFDLIVSNPPYICSHEIKTLAPEVCLYDPILALDGGQDGLDAYRALFKQVSFLLKDTGFFVLEIGKGQESDVIDLASINGLDFILGHHDLSKTMRALAFQLKAS
jgi:release factor glutamine methyltransferase